MIRSTRYNNIHCIPYRYSTIIRLYDQQNRIIMNIELLDSKGFAQKQRLKHIEFMIMFLGEISRGELVSKFGIGTAAASRDIAIYIEISTNNIEYNSQKKNYYKSQQFTPIFDYNANKVLGYLSGNLSIYNETSYVPTENPSELNQPSISIISTVSMAIHQNKAMSITYRSISSGKTSREIIPHTLVNNGLRWHVRAYDRKRARFTDFVLTRIDDATFLDSDIFTNENLTNDIQWNRVVELILIPHPNRKNSKTIEMDYNMDNKKLSINVRAAVAGYVLRRWNVDCTKDATLEGGAYHLWLKNRLALYGVEGLTLAPGFENDFE